MTGFTLECFQNEYLPEGADVMHAVVTVTSGGPAGYGADASPPAGGTDPADRAELLLIDVSGSMNGAKLQEAKSATAAAVDCLPDGVRFGVVAGNHAATVVYPPDPPLAVASDATRAEAREALRHLHAGGGTAIGSWIHLATQLFRHESGIRHAILLTDGRNEHETDEVLDRCLANAEGVFQCDCRGVGADWEVGELRRVATALLGSYDIVPDASGLRADFADMMQQALSRRVDDVRLRVWMPKGAELVVLKQLDPITDLTGSGVASSALSTDFATGAWGDESRDYHLAVRVPRGQLGDEMLGARVSLLVGDETTAQALVRCVWTDDAARSTVINRRVAAALGEDEMADAIQAGIEAIRSGDVEQGTARLGVAVRLATEQDNPDVVERLSALVDIEDAATGRVRPRRDVDATDMLIAETRSTRTVRTRR